MSELLNHGVVMYKHFSWWRLERIREQLVKQGYPEYWPELSDYLVEQANHTCQICGSKEKVQTHHIDGNPSNCDWDNLQVVCQSCNLKMRKSPLYRYNCLNCGKRIKQRGYCRLCNWKRVRV